MFREVHEDVFYENVLVMYKGCIRGVNMAMFFVGMGIDLSLTEKGLALIREADEVWLDNYTVIMPEAKSVLEKVLRIKTLGKEENERTGEVKLANRDVLESSALIDKAEKANIALVSVGDPFFATTHVTLYIEALKRNLDMKVAHNSSIFSVVGRVGLSPYKFGAVVTLPKWLSNYKPSSAFERLERNLSCGLHTLMLVDISDGKPMPFDEAIRTIHNIEEALGHKVVSNRELFLVSRAGLGDELILFGSLDELERVCVGKGKSDKESDKAVTEWKAAKTKGAEEYVEDYCPKHPYSFIVPSQLKGFETEAANFWRERMKIIRRRRGE